MKRSVVSIDLRRYAERLQLVILGTTQVQRSRGHVPAAGAAHFSLNLYYSGRT